MLKPFLRAVLICCVLALTLGEVSCGCDEDEANGDKESDVAPVESMEPDEEEVSVEPDAGDEGSDSSYFDFVDKARGL